MTQIYIFQAKPFLHSAAKKDLYCGRPQIEYFCHKYTNLHELNISNSCYADVTNRTVLKAGGLTCE